jgi:hypothetical protein
MEDKYLSFVHLLNEAGVEYIVLGGHAVIAHGYLRTTGDIDIFVGSTEDNAKRIIVALEQLGYTNGEFEISDFTERPSYISISRYDGYIDVMNETLGIEFDECYSKRIILDVHDIKVSFINIVDLIRNKKAVGRPKDIDDIANLTPLTN